MRVLKRIAKIFAWVLGSIVGVVLLLFLVIQIPAVQKKLTDWTASIIGSTIGLQVSIDHIHPLLWDGVSLEGVVIYDINQDTALCVHNLKVTIDDLNLESSRYLIDEISLEQPKIRVSIDTSNVWNIEPLFEALQSSDTTTSTYFSINNVVINNAEVTFNDYTQEQNIPFGINYGNLACENLNLRANSFKMDDGMFLCNIEDLSVAEKSGFTLTHLNSNVFISDTLIRCNQLSFATHETDVSTNMFEMKYNSFTDFSDFCEKVYLSADFNETKVALRDVAYFASPLKDMPYVFSLEGLLSGKIADFSAENFKINYGQNTRFVGNISAKGLPDIEKTSFSIEAKKLETTQGDIAQTRIPSFDTEQYVSMPDFLKEISSYKFIGVVQGVLSDMSTKGALATNVGSISVDARLKQDENLVCNGSLAFNEFDLSKVIANQIVGKTTGNFSINAILNSNALDSATLTGALDKFECNGYVYSNVEIEGTCASQIYHGKISVDDPNLKIRLDGVADFSSKIPKYKLKSKVTEANLNRLNLLEDSLANVSFAVKASFNGNDLDQMDGNVSVKKLLYSNAKGSINTNNILLSISRADIQRNIVLKSDYVDVSIEGAGKYRDLSFSILSLLNQHLPFLPSVQKKYHQAEDFIATVDIKNTDTLFAILQSDLRIANGSSIVAQYHKKDTVCNVSIRSPQIACGGLFLYDCNVTGSCQNSALVVDAQAAFDSKGNKVNAHVYAQKNDVGLSAKWQYDDIVNTSGTVEAIGTMVSKGNGKLPILNLEIQPTKFYVEDSLWNITKSNISIDTSSISILQFTLSKDAKKILVDGVVSTNPNDVITVNVENYDLSELNPLINNSSVRLGGPLHGRVRIKKIYEKPLLFADIKSDRLSFNDNLLGELHVRSFLGNREKAIMLNASIQNGEASSLALEGKYVLDADSLNCIVDINDINLSVIDELLAGTIDNLSGDLNGAITITGKLDELNCSGDVSVQNGSLLVSYTNVPYSFNGVLKAKKTNLYFSDFEITDPSKQKGIIRGFLSFKQLSNPQYLFAVQTPKLLVLNTTAQDNEYFYGTVYYDGSVKIEGDLDKTSISGTGTTLENTVISIPVSYSDLTGAYDFLLFASDTATVQKISEKQAYSSGLTVDLSLNVTPDAQAQIIFDPKVGDVIKTQGSGNLNLKVDEKTDIFLYGKYQMESGDYLFTLKNLINKRLVIQKGGSISWNGDPFNGQVDLIANYETKASPQPLLDSSINASKRIPVTCQVHLQNNLLSPDIAYDIVVPSSATQVNEVLATLSEDEKTLQFFSLLLQGAFISTLSESIAGSSVSFEVLSNQFSNLISQIDPNLDLSVNYRVGTNNTTNNEFEFGLSRQFWNDRILVNVNGYTDFGDESSNTDGEQSQSSDFYGNVSVEMKLNKQGTVKVKGFSRSNEDELSEKQENTNGVGFSFTKDFNTLEELFRRKNRKNSI